MSQCFNAALQIIRESIKSKFLALNLMFMSLSFNRCVGDNEAPGVDDCEFGDDRFTTVIRIDQEGNQRIERFLAIPANFKGDILFPH